MNRPLKSRVAAHRLCIIGCWHQATVLSACFAEMGHEVATVATDAAFKLLAAGKSPVHEPRLNSMLRRNIKAGRLRFTTDYAEALAGAEFVFIAIDTPVDDQDQPELQSVLDAARQIGAHQASEFILCVTAQVPVGTCERLAEIVREGDSRRKCDVAYIPEFLRLGEAVETFFRADRFIIGAQERAVAERVAELYKPLGRPMLLVRLRSAEMAKHASNTYLATSISFINEISNLCDAVQADAIEVAAAMKLDRRIGPYAFLSPGLGFAGGTLGRDIRALQELGEQHGCSMLLMDSVMQINHERARLVEARLREIYGALQGLRVGILGLTYKPGTSTLRRSISLDIIASLNTQGAEVRAFDPLADLGSCGSLPKFVVAPDPYALADACDALVLVTEWAGIRDLDLPRIAFSMRKPVFIDSRNLFDPAKMAIAGFDYFGIGRGIPMSAAITPATFK